MGTTRAKDTLSAFFGQVRQRGPIHRNKSEPFLSRLSSPLELAHNPLSSGSDVSSTPSSLPPQGIKTKFGHVETLREQWCPSNYREILYPSDRDPQSSRGPITITVREIKNPSIEGVLNFPISDDPPLLPSIGNYSRNNWNIGEFNETTDQDIGDTVSAVADPNSLNPDKQLDSTREAARRIRSRLALHTASNETVNTGSTIGKETKTIVGLGKSWLSSKNKGKEKNEDEKISLEAENGSAGDKINRHCDHSGSSLSKISATIRRQLTHRRGRITRSLKTRSSKREVTDDAIIHPGDQAMEVTP